MNIHQSQPWENQHRMDDDRNVVLGLDILNKSKRWLLIKQKKKMIFVLLLTLSINRVTGIGLSKAYWWLIHSVRINRLEAKKNNRVFLFWMTYLYQRIRASDAKPAIETPIWSSINIIFFWWADNSDGARWK